MNIKQIHNGLHTDVKNNIIGDIMKPIKISKEDFKKINEKDVMFITNPGRMGDEDGTTFIIKKDNNYEIYRIDGWMYGNKEPIISLKDAIKQFPEWYKAWNEKENYKGKYTYLYMGYGNGLSIDNSIYNKYKPYLDKEVASYLKDKEDKESLKYAAILNVWLKAFIDMINNK